MAKKSLKVIKYVLWKSQFANCFLCSFRHERVYLRLGVCMTHQLSTHLASLPVSLLNWIGQQVLGELSARCLLSLFLHDPDLGPRHTHLLPGCLLQPPVQIPSSHSCFHPVNFLHTRESDLRTESDFIIFLLKPLQQVHHFHNLLLSGPLPLFSSLAVSWPALALIFPHGLISSPFRSLQVWLSLTCKSRLKGCVPRETPPQSHYITWFSFSL